jgi:hypothetical protein
MQENHYKYKAYRDKNRHPPIKDLVMKRVEKTNVLRCPKIDLNIQHKEINKALKSNRGFLNDNVTDPKKST